MLKVQNTNLFAIDPVDGSIIDIDCVTSIDGIDSAVASTAISCISKRVDTKIAGNITPGSLTFGINFDPSEPSHLRLHELKSIGATLQWAIGLSDFAMPTPDTVGPVPTVDTNGDFVLPDDRSFVTFPGFMTSYPLAFAAGGVVASTIGVEMTDDFVIVPAA